jgi:hypothetical protein
VPLPIWRSSGPSRPDAGPAVSLDFIAAIYTHAVVRVVLGERMTLGAAGEQACMTPAPAHRTGPGIRNGGDSAMAPYWLTLREQLMFL